MDQDLADVIDATRPDQLRALSHPLRNRILTSLDRDGATISQLANRLRTNKGNVAHHLGVLVSAGLVRKGRTRTVRGGTEQYFLPVGRRVRFGTGPDGAPIRAMLATVADEIPPDDHLLNLRHLRLTANQAAALSDHLEKLITDLRPAGPRELEHGVIVGVWRKAE